MVTIAQRQLADVWASLPQPLEAMGAERATLRRALMVTRLEGARWSELGELLGVEPPALRAWAGCMPRHGNRQSHDGRPRHEKGGRGDCCAHHESAH